MKNNNTRRVKVDQTMFASPSGGVTLIGPDDQVWQGNDHPQILSAVGNAGLYKNGAEPNLEPSDFINQIRVGSNRTLWQSEIVDGVAKWVQMLDLHPDTSLGFDLPTEVEDDAVLESDVIDNEGVVLSQFIGSYASYWRMNAIRAFWNGIDFYTDDHKHIECPESFKRGIPSIMGFDGLIYIPREEYIEDLLLTQNERELSKNPFHDSSIAGRLEFNPTTGKHNITQRQIGGQDAQECYNSAWDHAIFEIVDIYTEPKKTFEERRLLLDSTVKPLQSAYKQIRVIPINPILSKSWAQQAFETLPSTAALVFNDPANYYTGAVDPVKQRTMKPRRKIEKKERGAPLVGWRLDASGCLDTLIVEGTDNNKSAVQVGEGYLWVCDPAITTVAIYANNMKARENMINSTGDSETFAAREAFKADADENARTLSNCVTNKNTHREKLIARITTPPSDVVAAARSQTAQSEADYVKDHSQLGVYYTRLTPTDTQRKELTNRVNLISVLRLPIVGYAPNEAAAVSIAGNMSSVGGTVNEIAELMAHGLYTTSLLKRLSNDVTTLSVSQRIIPADSGEDLVNNAAILAHENEFRTSASQKSATLFTTEFIALLKKADDGTGSDRTVRSIANTLDLTLSGVTPNLASFESEIAKILNGNALIGTKTDAAANNDTTADAYARAKGYLERYIISNAKAHKVKNLYEWNTFQRENYQKTFPMGCLISYKMKKGAHDQGEEDTYTMTKVVIV